MTIVRGSHRQTDKAGRPNRGRQTERLRTIDIQTKTGGHTDKKNKNGQSFREIDSLSVRQKVLQEDRQTDSPSEKDSLSDRG